MRTALALALFAAASAPASAQSYTGPDPTPDAVVVAEIEREAIQPLLDPSEVEGLFASLFVLAEHQRGRRPQFEQSWVERGPTFRLVADAQFENGDDFKASFDLEEVSVEGRRLLVLVRPRD